MAKWRRRTPSAGPAERRQIPLDLPRFAKLCAMLASPNEGERASAGLKASEMLKAADLTWEDVIKDSKALAEHLTLTKSDNEEARAHRFWKTRGSADHSRAQSDAT
ncbi:hypothetical protein [Hyphomicrobium sp. 99]|uniref:hypothetical protein n=1 Tax=Hyphomicrobium sp. 99 TaxID=1163419 RepID=UPI0005F82396|nr:hypothetical protein [Hyphomicrobium sp. 99]